MNAEQESIYTLDHPAVVASLEAMSLGRKSWEAARDECYVWLKVRENLDPGAGSNVGQRNICWTDVTSGSRRSNSHNHYYKIQLRVSGVSIVERLHAPKTLSEARSSPLLAQAVAKRDELWAGMIAKYGEPAKRTVGLGDEIRKVLRVSPAGREYLSRSPSCVNSIMERASVAAAYKPDDWARHNSAEVHVIFFQQQDRLELLQRSWSIKEAASERKRRVAAAKATKRDPFHLDESPRAATPDPIDAEIDEWLKLTKRLDEAGVLVEAWIEYEDQQKFNGRKLKAVA